LTLSSAAPPGYAFVTAPPASIAAGSNGAFTVQLLSTTVGTNTAVLDITNNVPGGSPFVINLTGIVQYDPLRFELLLGGTVISNNQPNAIAFSNATQFQADPSLTFTISNLGTLQPLLISNITVPAGYLPVTNFPTNIAPGGSGVFTVQLNSSIAAGDSGNVVITDNDTNNNPFSFPVTGLVLTRILALSGSLDFGTVTNGFSNSLNFTISNAGNTNLTITGITYPGSVFSGSFSGVISSGQSHQVTVTFTPARATNYSGTLTVASDATSGASNLSITAFGVNTNLLLTILTNGPGKVAPNDAKIIKPGTKLALTATPSNQDYAFFGWTGTYNVTNNPLKFTMTNSTIVQANFGPNPFLPFVGSYNGLFWDTNGVTETNAGMLKGLALGVKGTYSASLLLNGASKALSGAFDVNNLQASKTVSFDGAEGNVTVTMNLTSNEIEPLVTGTVSNADWVATNLIAYHATNTLPAAEYTMLVPPDTNNAPPGGSPGGYGYALITNNPGTAKSSAAATARITGNLADGTSFTQTVPVSSDGFVPIYNNLYSGKGLLLGWINLDLANTNAVGATGLTWIHPATKSGLYQAGFINVLLTNQILLSPWTNASPEIMAVTNLTLLSIPDQTNLMTNFTIFINPEYKISQASGDTRITGSIDPKTGQVKLTVGSGASAVSGQGALLLDSASVGGFFKTKSNAGAIEITK
jgi:hypothetical protein